jgi:hypothetical protein
MDPWIWIQIHTKMSWIRNIEPMIGFPPFTFFIFIMISFRHLRAFLSRQQQIEELREQFQGDIVELTATNHLTGSTVVLYVLATDGTVEGGSRETLCS